MLSLFIAHIPRYRGPSLSQFTPTNHRIPQILCSVFKLKAPQVLKNDFSPYSTGNPTIAAYQHHINSTIQCPDVVSFCPFKPPQHHWPMLPLSSKKPSLDKEVFKNYRPVSNLNFISKILERVVAVQLQTHLDEVGLMTAFQSAYRKHHSTESALLNIKNDILLNMAKGSVTALTLLDLSAAFDTIDHTILLDRLNVYYGLSELALSWFKSYLSGRTHSVKVGSTLSHPAALHYGVPQGSVLGPILFSLYTNPHNTFTRKFLSLYPKTKELPKRHSKFHVCK